MLLAPVASAIVLVPGPALARCFLRAIEFNEEVCQVPWQGFFVMCDGAPC